MTRGEAVFFGGLGGVGIFAGARCIHEELFGESSELLGIGTAGIGLVIFVVSLWNLSRYSNVQH